jgi:uncharacterized protein (DUF1015 family)
MPIVHPFRAAQFRGGRGDVSTLVAPPYDVLDAAGKQRLLGKDPHNIVAIDLPHTPAKELGPPSAYEGAAETYRAWLKNGTLKRSDEPAIFAYRQTFRGADGKTTQRCGMVCTLPTMTLGPRDGGGVLPHEETFSGPKEDRMALMKATRCQLSPIFGLHADERGLARQLLQTVMSAGGPDMTATTDEGTLHEVWTITDGATIRAYQDALAGQDVFIADGHHRYTTGLNYLRLIEGEQSLSPVLVGMSDPGLVIWPTHRVLGGMSGYSFDAFRAAAGEVLDITDAGTDLPTLETHLAAKGHNRVGLYDFATRRCYLATFKSADPLAEKFPGKPPAWRKLDVALIQHVLVEGVCQPALNSGQPVKWAFPHTIAEVLEIGSGAETGAGGGKQFAQIAVIVAPTPLEAVREVSRANQLMPQKSTFFYPKLATGLFINPLE